MSTAELTYYRSSGEAEGTRRAGEIKGGLCAETREHTVLYACGERSLA